MEKPLKNETYEGIGLKLKKARMEKGYSQEKLANIIGKDQPNISRIEKGANATQASINEICEGLEISLQDLLSNY